MEHIFTKGLNIRLSGAPRQVVSQGNAAGHVAVFANDYPGVTPELLVETGDRVALGDPLFCDRADAAIRIVAPAGGVVSRIETGARRVLSLVEIACEGADARRAAPGIGTDPQSIATLMQEFGLWAKLVQRPFGRVPRPGARPSAIFVKAMESDPLSADARVVLSGRSEAFHAGIRALEPLTDGPVYVCQSPGENVTAPGAKVRVEHFSGPHPAGLTGTHVDRLHPVETGEPVWQIHYQDVIALGTVMISGRLPEMQVIALAGSGLRDPRLVEAPAGASLSDILREEIVPGDMRVLSGSPLSGRETSHVRRGHWQISVLARRAPRRDWRMPLSGRWAEKRPAAIIPTAALARAIGPDLPIVALIRALGVRDAETADRLGCRSLLEEDLALASYVTGGVTDYGALLRVVLDVLEAGA